MGTSNQQPQSTPAANAERAKQSLAHVHTSDTTHTTTYTTQTQSQSRINSQPRPLLLLLLPLPSLDVPAYSNPSAATPAYPNNGCVLRVTAIAPSSRSAARVSTPLSFHAHLTLTGCTSCCASIAYLSYLHRCLHLHSLPPSRCVLPPPAVFGDRRSLEHARGL